ncbi:MAG: ATP-binding cassette domain-containing protein [Deltaproteobacteria bacterium]|nr:ATP-binding cassette domain-containing protein [Deltaproteobacteria bacterium]
MLNKNDMGAADHAGARELISLTDIRLSLQGTLILRGVNLHVGDGEIYGMLGPNGAGKSTTISVISVLRKPDGGRHRCWGSTRSTIPRK